MKKIVAILALCLMAFSSAFAKKAKAAAEPLDSYDDEVTAITVDEENIKKSDNASSDPYNAKKMAPSSNRTFGEKLLGLNKFQKIEEFSLYVKSFGKAAMKNAHFIYREGTDIAGFMCQYDSSAYALQFAQASRGTLIAAINTYFDDFDNKRLKKRAKNTDQAYGYTEAYEDFGIMSAKMQQYSRPRVDFGYLFIDGSPFFVIYVRKAENLALDDRSGYEDTFKQVIAQRYYFTKSQAKALATFLSDENVSVLRDSTSRGAKSGEFDSYEEEAESNLE